MLAKLLKYDFKSLSKTLLPIFGISFIIAIITRGITMLADKFSILSVPAGILTFIFIIVLIAIPIVTFIFTILKFYKNLVKDEGYLMHTLPVSKNALVLSKLISSCTYLILSAIMIVLLVFVWGYGLLFDSKLLHMIWEVIRQSNTVFLILLLLSIVISVILNQVMIYASIALGQKHNSKVAFSVIYGIVLYNVTQILTVVLLVPFMLLDSNYQQYIENSNVLDFGLVNGFLTYALVISVLFIIVYYFVTVRTFHKKLNLD